MFSERLGTVYSALEEKYYAVLDFLDAKGVPVYTYNDFLEARGLPAFPVTIALIVLVLAGIYGLVFVGTGVNPAITLTFEDQFSEAVSGVSVSVRDSSGNLLHAQEKISNGGTLTLQGIPLGTELVLVAEKEGFDKAEKNVVVKREEITASIPMQKRVSAIDATVQLVDIDTGDLIRGALVSLEWQGQTKNVTTDSSGKASFSGIPGNTSVFLSINADGYEALSGSYSFAGGELKEISLVAGSASFAGVSSLIASIFDEAGQPVHGARVIVRDRDTDTSLEERTIEENEAVFSVAKGKSVRIVVEKEGFLRYDSMEEGESRTMRQDEELWPIVLKKGGSRLVATVFSGQMPLSDAAVQLFDANGNFVNEDVTGFGGSVEFSGLGPKEYFVTGYKQGFLPARQLVNVAGTETASLYLDSADNSNSAYLGISVLDSYRAMANNADLSFREKSGGLEFPLGIPALKTDISGYASIVARTGTLVVVEAKKEGEEGFGEKLVEVNKENQLVVELARPVGVVELDVFDAEGNLASGHALIESVSGLLLFDGNISEGRVFFDAEGYSEAMVTIETGEGETFSQRVNLEGKELVEISLGKAGSGLAPTISFVGVFDEDNQPAQGLVKGEDYWLAFQSTWPSGAEKGGVHIRLGQDGIAFVDSQEAGVTGFEAPTSDYFYGKSFQPLPAPGNETADRQNMGMPGQLNKFVELYFDSPENTVAFRVKAKANNSISKDNVELHYRAWVEAAGSVYRNPNDAELGEKMFTETKTGLYAETEDSELKVFAAKAECEQELCGNYFFVMPTGLYVEKQDFKAVTEETYALEIDLSSSKPVSITLKLDTDKALPRIQFTGYDVDDFADQQEQDPLPPETSLSGQGYIEFAAETVETGNPLGFKSGSTGTSITINALGVSPERPRKVRAYFKGVEEGKAEIKMQAVGESVLDESFVFNVERNKELLVSVTPANPEIGEAFTARVLDGETGDAIQDASVQVKNAKGEIVSSVVGRGSTRRGLRGEYYFKNSFGPGIYTIVVSAAGYKSEQLEIAIARDNLLAVDSPVKIDILKESGEKTIALAIRNNAGEDVKELAYEIEKDSDFPEEFSVSVSMPAVAGKGQDTTASIRVIVNRNEDSEESLYGEANLAIKGMVAGNYPTKTVARLQISYNKQLDPDCLYFDSESLMVRLIGRAGSTATEEFEVENRCETALDLRVSMEAAQEDPNLSVSVSPLRIEKGAIGKVKVTVSNRIERNYDLQNRRYYRIKLESSQIAKTIPLNVELWNPRTNLGYPANISLWMIRSAAEELAFAQAPLQVINNGAIPITAFRVAVTPEAYMQGITAGIKPDNIYDTTLYPGQPWSPERYVYAESKRTDAMQKAGQGWITFTGVVEGRQYPDLGRASLSINYSGTKCLKASAVESLVFSSTEAGQGTLERKIRIRNECGEPVRIAEKVRPETIGGNAFVLNAPYTLAPGQETEARLVLMKKQETSTSAAIKIAGILMNQNEAIESNELRVTLKLGAVEATPEGKHTAELAIKKCGSDEIMQVAFPVLSSDCSSGYCDAEQLAKFLVDKAETLVKTAKDLASRAGYSTEKFSNCAQANKESCSFDDMGIISEQFPVFLQLDFMTEAVLLKALGESKELKGYDVVQGTKSVDNTGSVGFGFGNVYLGGVFKGCGKYYVELSGAARVSNREIVAGKNNSRDFLVAINVTQPRVTTEECQPRVENASNFLPVDKGYTDLENYQAWPGFVQAGAEFDSLGKKFAEELFGKADGRYGANISSASNKLEIVKGGEGSGLLKILVPATGKPDEPKTMYAHVPAAYTKEMEGEIAKALKAFQQKAFSQDDCWGEDESGQYIAMKGYKDVDKLYGKLEISGENAIRINTQEQCVDMSISSKAAELATFTTDFLTPGKNASKDGIEYVAIKDAKGNILYQENANDKKKQGPELRLAKEKEESGNYTAKFSFCVKGTSLFPLALEKIREISVTGKGSATLDRKTEPYKVALQACGIHPAELVKKIAERETAMPNGSEETYYAMPGWAGKPEPPEELDLTKFRNMYALQEELEGKVATTGERLAGLSSYEKAMQPYRYGSIAVYFAACAVPAFFLPWGSVTFDCALPAVWAALDVNPSTESAKDFVIDLVKKTLGPIGKATIAPIVNGITKLFGGEGKWDPMAEKESLPYMGDDQAETEFETMLDSVQEFSSAGTTVFTKSLLGGLSGAGTTVSLESARNLMASNIWDNFAEEFVNNKAPGLVVADPVAAAALQKELADNAKDAAAELLFESGGPGVRPSQWHFTTLKAGTAGKPLEEAARIAIDQSYAKSQAQFDEILGNVLGGTTPPAGLKGLSKNTADKIFDSTKYSDDLVARLQGESLEGLASGTRAQMKERIANQILQSMERNNKAVVDGLVEQFGSRSALQAKILASVDSSWATIPGRPNLNTTLNKLLTSTTLPRNTDIGKILETMDATSRARYAAQLKGSVDDIVNRALVDFGSTNSDDVYKAMHKTVNGQMLAKLKGDYADDLAKLVKEGTSKPGALTRIGRFFRGLGLGALSGVASNALGLLAHRLYWEGVGNSPVESDTSFKTSELTNITDEDGKVIGQTEVLRDIKIVKNQPYKVVIRKANSGKTETRLIKLTTEEQLREMADAIKKNPESSWNTDCKSYGKEGLGLLVGALSPSPNSKVKQDEVFAYRDNEQAIAYYSNYYINPEKKTALPEELLMAVLLEQPEKIKGCAIQEKWWTKKLDEDERVRVVGCAAARLNASLEKDKKLDSFTNADDKGAYVQNVKARQVEWAKFRVKEAS